MNIVIDTNILVASLIKDSISRKVLVESDFTFFYPEIAFHEVRKYKDLVLEKSCMSDEEYIKLLAHLLKHITLVTEEQIKEKLDEANKILGKIDLDDVVFLAAALSIEDSKMWSDDAHFDSQAKVIVFKTAQIVNLFSDETRSIE